MRLAGRHAPSTISRVTTHRRFSRWPRRRALHRRQTEERVVVDTTVDRDWSKLGGQFLEERTGREEALHHNLQ